MTDWIPPGPGPWQQDSAHNPVAQTRAMQEAFPPGFNKGFGETFARYGILLDRLALAHVNGFPYHQPQPFDMPGPDGPLTPEQIGAEVGRRAAVAAEVFETRRWRADLEEWDQVAKPAALARHRALGQVDLPDLSDAELAAHLEEAAAHVTSMVEQHHRYNMAALLPVGDFALQASSWLRRDPASLLAALDGYSPVSAVASDELEDILAALRGDDEASSLVHGPGDAAKRLAVLRERTPAVDDYLRSAGARVVEGFDVVAPTLLERPELVLGRFAAALAADPGEARRRADAFAASLREQLDADQQQQFDDLLAEARAVYRLRDERGLYSDITAIGLLRLAMLEAGRRLNQAGRLNDPDLALDAGVAELASLLSGGSAPTGDELAERRATRLARTAEGAPRFLGPPPPPPPPVDQLPPPLARVMSSVGFLIEGILGQLDSAAGDETHVTGVPASAGTVEGTARLVRGVDEIFRLEDGDVLVAPTTGEAFNSMLHLVAAIVTDHGSFASHAAIVGREMGIPVVVGTVDGTSRIPDGARVRVDGSAGEVTVLD